MSALGVLAAAVVVCVFAAALLLRALRPALDELCASAERGGFWTRYAALALAAGVVLCALVASIASAAWRVSPWSALLVARAAFFGTLLALAPLSAAVLAFTSSGVPGGQRLERAPARARAARARHS